MPTYVSLMRFTNQGIRDVKESPSRLEDARKAFAAAGAELKEFYLTLGQYDAIVVFEAPNDEVTAKLGLAIGALGNLRTETARAFTETEYRKLIGAFL
jgi:uncharacterized protein with GYD domain